MPPRLGMVSCDPTRKPLSETQSFQSRSDLESHLTVLNSLTFQNRAPSIIWQAVWNYIAGPYLLWKIRMINDIYNWRLQTTIALVLGYDCPDPQLWICILTLFKPSRHSSLAPFCVLGQTERSEQVLDPCYVVRSPHSGFSIAQYR